MNTVLCLVIFLVLNFFLVCAAVYVALKALSKQLVAIIEECEKMDRDEMFVKQWCKHNK